MCALSRWWVLFRAWEGREGSPVVGLGPKLAVKRAALPLGPHSTPSGPPAAGVKRQAAGLPRDLASLCSDQGTFVVAEHCLLEQQRLCSRPGHPTGSGALPSGTA